MSEKEFDQPQYDPLLWWKQFQDVGMRGWAKMMNDLVASEEFASSVGHSVTQYLESSAPMRQQISKITTQYLEQMNMPTRDEMTRLAERLINLEMRVDDIDAKMDEALERLKAIQAKLE